jgi:hypothetical protein
LFSYVLYELLVRRFVFQTEESPVQGGVALGQWTGFNARRKRLGVFSSISSGRSVPGTSFSPPGSLVPAGAIWHSLRATIRANHGRSSSNHNLNGYRSANLYHEGQQVHNNTNLIEADSREVVVCRGRPLSFTFGAVTGTSVTFPSRQTLECGCVGLVCVRLPIGCRRSRPCSSTTNFLWSSLSPVRPGMKAPMISPREKIKGSIDHFPSLWLSIVHPIQLLVTKTVPW